MALAKYTLARRPLAALDPADSQAVFTPLADLLDRFESDYTVLVTVKVYDKVSKVETTLYLGSEDFVNLPTDPDPNRFWAGDLSQPLFYRASLLSSERLAGRLEATSGFVDVVNIHGAYDDTLRVQALNGREVVVWVVKRGASFAGAVKVFQGVVETRNVSPESIRLNVRSRTRLAEQPVQPNVFAGTGGVEGGADLKDKPLPICIGKPRGVTPVRTENVSGRPTYKISGTPFLPIQGDAGCWDNGVALLRAASFPPSAGEYHVDTATGVLTLFQEPNGQITIDPIGWVRNGQLVSRVADIICALYEDVLGVPATDISSEDVAAMNAIVPWEAQAWIGSVEKTLASVIDELHRGSASWGFWDNDSVLRLGVLQRPGGAAVIQISDQDVLASDPSRNPPSLNPPAWQHRIKYARNYTVMTDLEGAGVDEAQRSFMQEEYRTVLVDGDAGDAIKEAFPDSKPLETITPFVNQTDAQAFGTLLQAAMSIDAFPVEQRVNAIVPELTFGSQMIIDDDNLGFVQKRAGIYGIEVDYAQAESRFTALA